MEIIYTDDNIIAVNKPAGISMHPDRFHQGDTVADWLVKTFPEVEGVGDYSARPEQGYRAGTVHRLDKDTSGVLVVARTQEAFDFLKKQFQERTVKKEYRALVVGRIKNKEGVIDLPIGRAKNDPTKRVAKGAMRGKVRDAVTEYKVIEYFGDDFTRTLHEDMEHVRQKRDSQLVCGYTFLKAFPKTGRTHQIRSHVKALGYPVVCDTLYAGKRYVCPFGLERHFLHAFALEIKLPKRGMVRLEADMPNDLVRVLDGLRKGKKDDTVLKSK